MSEGYRQKILGYTIIFCICGFQLGWHAFLLSKLSAAKDWEDVYTYRHPVNNKSSAGYLDIVVPSLFLAVGVGIASNGGRRALFVFNVVVAATLNTLLVLIYVKILPSQVTWWWPHTGNGVERSLALLRAAVETALLTGVIGYGVLLQGERRN